MRSNLLILAVFTAALSWCIALLGIVNSPAGAIFVTVPALASTGIVVAARRRRRTQARQLGAPTLNSRTALRAQSNSVLILLSFTAVLCWWIAIVGLGTGAGAFFLWLPVLVTAGTVAMWLYMKGWKVTRI
ncbi:hypothetical protein [Arthrobacter sp. ISL-95]|uniref:hypothetical protein n=1 Tax=Arthrobacter sp. ISL-95 TaxID=2819116 RepID=UPI0025708A09|nr:hypothetical protein [Arthrobacter sp. ISL-95]